MSVGGSNVLLTTQEAADYIRVPVKTLRGYWRTWGLKPPHKVGREYRWRVRDLESWLEAHRAA